MSLVLMQKNKNRTERARSIDKRVASVSSKTDKSFFLGSVNLGALGVGVICGLVFSGVLYLSQVNGIAIKGFDMRDAEKYITTLQKQNEKLKIQEAELTSMNNVENSISSLNLVVPSNVTYVELNRSVAMK